MAEYFQQGCALLIGVTDNAAGGLALPMVGRDVEAVHRVLTHPERCAYLSENVKTLTGTQATRAGILDGFEWLQERLRADASGNTTAIIYYSGHGWRDTSTDPAEFFLIPYDMHENRIRSSALRAQDFGEAVNTLQPRRLLVILDCCHAGGMDVKELSVAIAGFVETAITPDLLMGEDSALTSGDKGLHGLAEGAGRAVLSSSKGEQRSYIRRDGAMSIFTYHLIEALSGHAQPQQGATEVLVSDVMGHVSRHVPRTAFAESGARQEPDYRVSGNFPVALLLGGKGLREGQPPPDPLSLFEEAGARTVSVTIQTGGGDITAGDKIVGQIGNVGPGSQAAIGSNISQQIASASPGLPAADHRTPQALPEDLERKGGTHDGP
jgi:hypothetical protein